MLKMLRLIMKQNCYANEQIVFSPHAKDRQTSNKQS